MKKLYHKEAKKILLDAEEVDQVPNSVTAAYMLNPYIILSCVAMSTTVFANMVSQ